MKNIPINSCSINQSSSLLDIEKMVSGSMLGCNEDLCKRYWQETSRGEL